MKDATENTYVSGANAVRESLAARRVFVLVRADSAEVVPRRGRLLRVELTVARRPSSELSEVLRRNKESACARESHDAAGPLLTASERFFVLIVAASLKLSSISGNVGRKPASHARRATDIVVTFFS